MSFQERRNIVYLINSLLIFGGYGVYVWQLSQDGRLEETNWGVAILVLIPVHILVSIITEIIFVILNTIATREEEPDIVDEFDQSVILRATRNAYYTFSIGFLVAMATVAGELPMHVMFNTLVFSFFMAELAWVSSNLYFYRRGF